MSANRLNDECESLRKAVAEMRLQVKALEAQAPQLCQQTSAVRTAMIEVISRVNAIEATVGGLCMSGLLPAGRTREQSELLALEASLHRAGDHTQDHDEPEERA